MRNKKITSRRSAAVTVVAAVAAATLLLVAHNNNNNNSHKKYSVFVDAFAPPPSIQRRPAMPKTSVLDSRNNNHRKLFSHTTKSNDPVTTTHLSSMIDNTTNSNNNKKKMKKGKNNSSTVGETNRHPTRMAAAATTAALALALSFLSPFDAANAAISGGRMGGSFAPSTRSAPAMRSSSYSSRPRSASSTTTIVSPSVQTNFGYSPFASPYYNSFGGPRFYYGGGPGVISATRGPSFFDLLFFGGFAFAVSQIFLNSSSNRGSFLVDESTDGDSVVSALVAGPVAGTSVLQLSVALEVPNRDDPDSILSVLERLSQTASTDSRVGIQDVSSQVALELLRRKSSIVSADFVESKHNYRNRQNAMREFQSRSVRERSKFEKETVNKFSGVDYNYAVDAASNDNNRLAAANNNDKATMAVVTIILAIDGDDDDQTTKEQLDNIRDVENALRRIASDVKTGDRLQSAEILWTPTDRSETLSERDVVADYPDLRTV